MISNELNKQKRVVQWSVSLLFIIITIIITIWLLFVLGKDQIYIKDHLKSVSSNILSASTTSSDISLEYWYNKTHYIARVKGHGTVNRNMILIYVDSNEPEKFYFKIPKIYISKKTKKIFKPLLILIPVCFGLLYFLKITLKNESLYENMNTRQGYIKSWLMDELYLFFEKVDKKIF